AAPTAGNAGGALAAYAARAGLPAFIAMPQDTPLSNQEECVAAGAHVILVDGLITDAGRLIAQGEQRYGWFNVATLKEPYRLEGKKCMGLELAEQLGWSLPDVIVYPTGGGTGLIGMWKAFDELEALGWIGPHRPRMIAVQATGCAPIVEAFRQGLDQSAPIAHAHTCASGIRVPKALGDFIILRILRQSGGEAVAVDDEAICAAMQEMATAEGIFPAPEGAATWAGLRKLVEAGRIDPGERVVLFNTGGAAKYPGRVPVRLPVLAADATLELQPAVSA
ncbi:MAG TPA: threonine synthase, partial [Limnochordia bacterium]|nr:threonine synthase [Limnochordia bacterium]